MQQLPTFGEVIRAWRNHRGLKSYELAQNVGVRPEQMSRIERTDTTPRKRTLEAFAKALKIPLDTLVHRHLPGQQLFPSLFVSLGAGFDHPHISECEGCRLLYADVLVTLASHGVNEEMDNTLVEMVIAHKHH